MGSSYAAGPGVGERDPGSPTHCERSADNYAHLLASWRNLDLTDVSCSGATTHDILAPSASHLPAQVDAVTSATRLVTVTVGGNDIGYISTLLGLSCQDAPTTSGSPPKCSIPSSASVEAGLAKLPASLAQVISAIRQRAPKAQIVLVDYVRVVPGTGSCPTRAPLSDADQRQVFQTHAKLTAVIAQAAQAGGVGVLRASAASVGHDICSVDPWVFGFYPPPAADPSFPHDQYHPNIRAMAVIAIALDRLLYSQ